jgi:hypothetical protein
MASRLARLQVVELPLSLMPLLSPTPEAPLVQGAAGNNGSGLKPRQLWWPADRERAPLIWAGY